MALPHNDLGILFAAVSENPTDDVRFYCRDHTETSQAIVLQRPGQDKVGITALAVDSLTKKIAIGREDGTIAIHELGTSVFQELSAGDNNAKKAHVGGRVMALKFCGQLLASAARAGGGDASSSGSSSSGSTFNLWNWRDGISLLRTPFIVPGGVAASWFCADWIIHRDASNKVIFSVVLVGSSQVVLTVAEEQPQQGQQQQQQRQILSPRPVQQQRQQQPPSLQPEQPQSQNAAALEQALRQKELRIRELELQLMQKRYER